ncbi:glycosyltransferase family 2 protein [Magnetococcales bacterium HHB-1]
MISIVCPFYNESAIIEKAVQRMLRNLESLEEPWELIVVNDGSKDNSKEIVSKIAEQNARLRLVSYDQNQGRGHALHTGIFQAKGEFIITTEIDCSWGDDIPHRLAQALKETPEADIVIASPNLDKGRYENVPKKRVWLSQMGNQLIRASLGVPLTMYTGMTRGYRRDAIRNLPLSEKGKEFHLEVVSKALAFNYHIIEIPAILAWQEHKLLAGNKTQRQSKPKKMGKIMRSHALFTLVSAPFRYIFPASIALALLGLVFFFDAIYRLFLPTPSIYVLFTAFFLFLFAFLIFIVGVLTYQNISLNKELWWIRRELQTLRTTSKNPKA